MNPLQEDQLASRNLSDHKSPATITIGGATATDKLFEVSPVLRNDNLNSTTRQMPAAHSPLLQHAQRKQKQFTHSPIIDAEKNTNNCTPNQARRDSLAVHESLSTIASR